MRRLFPENTFVPPQLPSGNDIVRIVIGEAPGQEEQEQGRPFVGGAGKWLDSMLRHAGIARSGLTIVNCVNCRPPDNIFPTDPDAKKYISKEDGLNAVHHCLRTHVKPLLESRQWSRVDLLGDKALNFIAGKDGVYKFRGSPLEIDTDKI